VRQPAQGNLQQQQCVLCGCSGAANEYHVFISHAGQDKLDFVTFLFDELKERGVKCFLDYDEQDGLVPGTPVSPLCLPCVAMSCVSDTVC
jgi:hypothetical protein